MSKNNNEERKSSIKILLKFEGFVYNCFEVKISSSEYNKWNILYFVFCMLHSFALNFVALHTIESNSNEKKHYIKK